MCVCSCVSDFQRFKPLWLINGLRCQYEICYTSEAITTLQLWLFSWQLMPDLWFYRILNFLKKDVVALTYVKLKRSNFFKFRIFWEFSQNYLTQANFDLSSWNFVCKCTDIEWCFLLNFVKISQDLWILDEFKFFYFFIVTSNLKNSMYPWSFPCEKAKIEQRSSAKKQLCKIGEKAIWESRFTSCFPC